MTMQEKQDLGNNIKHLTPAQLKGIIEIMRDVSPGNNDVLEFDLNALDPKKCRELDFYVKKCLRGAAIKKANMQR